MLRNPVSHKYHCCLLTGVLQETDSVTYGVNYERVLNQLDDFSVGNTQLPQDVMHILLEGVLPYTIKAMTIYINNPLLQPHCIIYLYYSRLNVRSNFYTQCIINSWNNLSHEVVAAHTTS